MAGSLKNAGISPSASDLGLGDMLKTQIELDEEERKKKMLQSGKKSQALATSPAATALGLGGY
jgi:hypothetical protein